jgi:putative ABC transport system substrate-binding protein
LAITPRVPKAFVDELGRGGFAEGRNLEVDGHGFGVAPALFDAMAIELARSRPDVILAIGSEAAHAAQRATRSIAIVAMADDLETSGLIKSMPHPEGNITGVRHLCLPAQRETVGGTARGTPGSSTSGDPCRP